MKKKKTTIPPAIVSPSISLSVSCSQDSEFDYEDWECKELKINWLGQRKIIYNHDFGYSPINREHRVCIKCGRKEFIYGRIGFWEDWRREI